MEIWVLVLLLFIYMIIEFFNAFLFNWKLFLLIEKKYIAAGLFSAFSTLLLISSLVISVYFSLEGDSDPIWWFIPVSAIFMGIGNFIAVLILPRIRVFLKRQKNKSTNIKNID